MHLHSPSRPKLPDGKPSWLFRQNLAVPDLSLKPLASGKIELSLFLPIKAGNLAFSRFNLILDPSELVSMISSFISSPEEFCEKNFTSEYEGLKLSLKQNDKRGNENYDEEERDQSQDPSQASIRNLKSRKSSRSKTPSAPILELNDLRF